jgi:hypothetical protein
MDIISSLWSSKKFLSSRISLSICWAREEEGGEGCGGGLITMRRGEASSCLNCSYIRKSTLKNKKSIFNLTSIPTGTVLTKEVTFVGPNIIKFRNFSVLSSDSLDKSHETMLDVKQNKCGLWVPTKKMYFSPMFFLLITVRYFTSVFKDKNFFCLLMEGSGSRSVQNNDDLDPGGPKTYRFYGYRSATLVVSLREKTHDRIYLYTNLYSEPRTGHF